MNEILKRFVDLCICVSAADVPHAKKKKKTQWTLMWTWHHQDICALLSVYEQRFMWPTGLRCPVCPRMTRWFVLHPHSNCIMTSETFGVSQQPLHQNAHTSPDDASLQPVGSSVQTQISNATNTSWGVWGDLNTIHEAVQPSDACFLWHHCTQLLMHLQCNVIKEVSIDIMLIPRTAFTNLSHKKVSNYILKLHTSRWSV